jgi:hypothetical protein
LNKKDIYDKINTLDKINKSNTKGGIKAAHLGITVFWKGEGTLEAIVTNFNSKTGIRRYRGKILMNGFDRITLACSDKEGNIKIKTFKKDKWKVQLI